MTISSSNVLRRPKLPPVEREDWSLNMIIDDESKTEGFDEKVIRRLKGAPLAIILFDD
ncbi:hypothetical protein LB456_00105 [Psychroflexus sp. CAK57W]|uniref:hypothetical protein n=1 Tax=Psychroflexus curvus TaxID=2873595 RepID=UPI001CCB5938|nr:hypothetical protein [Psychroflexus curvus]MBZ9785849.1 hypothetical protein [Psychroflexus curvus]